MVRQLFIIFIGFTSFTLSAQVQVFDQCEDSTLYVKSYYKGTKVDVRCDTVFMLSKSTFYLMKNLYDETRSGDDEDVIRMVSGVTKFYESRVTQMQLQYDQLMTQYTKLAEGSGEFADNSKASLQALTAKIDQANQNLETANELLKESKKNVMKDKLKKYVWLGGGLGIGFIVGFLAN